MNDDLMAFLRARLDEDQARAEAMEHFTVPEQPYYSCAGSRTEPYGDLDWGDEHCDCFLAKRKARALREVAAKRAILDRCKEWLKLAPRSGATWSDDAGFWAAAQVILPHLAAVYSDHLDYRKEWNEN